MKSSLTIALAVTAASFRLLSENAQGQSLQGTSVASALRTDFTCSQGTLTVPSVCESHLVETDGSSILSQRAIESLNQEPTTTKRSFYFRAIFQGHTYNVRVSATHHNEAMGKLKQTIKDNNYCERIPGGFKGAGHEIVSLGHSKPQGTKFMSILTFEAKLPKSDPACQEERESFLAKFLKPRW